MKKTKILVVLGALLAMSLSACGGGKKEEHKHVYENWTQTKAPTCTEKGEEEGTCKCGEKSTRPVNALGHDWGEWAVKTAASCTTDGVEERACKRAGCNEKETRVVKAAHDWDAEQDVAAGTDPENQVGYKLANCKNGDAVKLDIRAVDAKFYKGGIKQSTTNPTPDGYFKLGSKNDKAYWRFTLAGTKMYKGMLYQYGAMDSFSGNTDKSYAMTSTSGDHAPSYPLGNFDVQVNGDSLDKSQWIDILFSELLADGDDSSAMGSDFSPLCLCPIGECVIQPGANEITYERLGSYNLLISDLIFIGSEFQHVHAAADAWSSDETGHWHACTAPGCPTGKADAVVPHTLEEVAAEGVAATCKAEGKKVEKCSVCGFKKETVLPKLAHTLGEAYDVVPATCEAAGSQKKKCSVCDEVITEVLPKVDHKFGDIIESFPAGEGYIATTGHNCSVCNKGALRWSALDYDATASSTGLDRQSTYVRFASGAVENKGGTEAVGSHIIYKVSVAAAQEKVGLAFKIKNTGGNNGNADVFGPITNDTSVGYIKNADGTFIESTHRYGLRVNDVEYFLGDNNYGNQPSATGWFEWPVEFPVKAGVNTIDVFPYRGYRAQLMEFELTGLPKFESSHLHNGDATWLNDADNHWHKCTAEGCPLADGIYDKAAHTFVKDEAASSDPTTTANGLLVEKCSVCQKVKETVIPALNLKEWVKEDLTNVIPGAANLTKTTYANDIVGYKWNNATNAVANFKYTPAAAGNYTLKLLLSPKSGNQASTGFWKQGSDAKTKITVNGVELTAPDTDLDFTVCQTKSATARDGTSSMMEPVWFEIANVALTAGENTITLQYLTGGYSYFLCGAAIANVIA